MRIGSIRTLFLLAPPELRETVFSIVRGLDLPVRICPLATADDLADALAEAGGKDFLLSFGSGLIVPGEFLRRIDWRAVNIHAASPAYPGRDPHHFAVYEGAARYGATAHLMLERVDAGPILDVVLFDVPESVTPHDLLAQANVCGIELCIRLLGRLKRGEELVSNSAWSWSPHKRTRAHFLELCRVTPDMLWEEYQRRKKAVAAPGYRNLRLELHGDVFYLGEEQLCPK